MELPTTGNYRTETERIEMRRLASIFVPAILVGGSAMAQVAADYPKVSAYSAGSVETESADMPLLRTARVARSSMEVPAEAWPDIWTGETAPDFGYARLQIALDAAGVPQQCDVLDTQVTRAGSTEKLDTIAAPLRQALCDIGMTRLRYNYALDQDGRPAADRIHVGLRYERERMEAPPAPWPPASFVLGENDWLPKYFFAGRYANARFADPDGRSFVSRDRSRPRRANVDMLVSSDAEGSITECSVAVPSGVAEFDDVSCAAFSSVVQPPRMRNVPVRLAWDRRSAKTIRPSQPRGPELRGDMQVRADLVSGIDIPRYAQIAVELRVDAEGDLASCRVISPSYVDALDLASCRTFEDARFTVPRGPFGDADRGGIALRVDWNTLEISRYGL